MRNNKTCDTWYTSWYLPSFKLMVAVHRKVFDYCTYKAFNIIFPTFSVNADGGSKWLNEVLRSLDRGFLYYMDISTVPSSFDFQQWHTYIFYHTYIGAHLNPHTKHAHIAWYVVWAFYNFVLSFCSFDILKSSIIGTIL